MASQNMNRVALLPPGRRRGGECDAPGIRVTLARDEEFIGKRKRG